MELFDLERFKTTNTDKFHYKPIMNFDNQIITEVDWLSSHPSTAYYHSIRQRIENTKQNKDILLSEYGLAKQFLQNLDLGKNVKIDPSDQIVVEFAKDLINLVSDDLTKQICEDIMNILITGIKSLNSSIVKSIIPHYTKNERFYKLSGRYDVIAGSILDISLLKYGNVDYEKEIKLNIDKKSEFHCDDYTKKKFLIELELRYWEGIQIQIMKSSPIKLNRRDKLGDISCIKIFPMITTLSSLIACGTTLGRLIIYQVSWTGREDIVPVASSPSTKNELNKYKIIDIQFSTTGPQSISTLNVNGDIVIWCMNSILQNLLNNKGTISIRKRLKLNSINFLSKGSILSMSKTCQLSHMDATLAFPTQPQSYSVDPYDEDHLIEQVQEKNTLFSTFNPFQFQSNYTKTSSLDPGKFTTTLCFHPSMTLFGRNPSIMVGTSDGSLVKFNTDYLDGGDSRSIVDAEILYIPPFVSQEYIHSSQAPKGFVLVPGQSKRKGNKVYRELFHYHKYPIIFLQVLENTSDCIVSIDSEGYTAIWRYQKQYFSGKIWFRPYKTYRINLTMSTYKYTESMIQTDEERGASSRMDDYVVCEKEPSKDVLDSLKPRLITKNEEFITVYHPIASMEQIKMIEYCTIESSDDPINQKSLNDLPNEPPKGPVTTLVLNRQKKTWHYRFVDKIERKELEILKIKQTFDGDDVVIMLRNLMNHPTMLDSQEYHFTVVSSYRGKEDGLALNCQHPSISISCPMNGVIDCCVGPIVLETLTRALCLLMSNLLLRIFSLETNQEVYNLDLHKIFVLENVNTTRTQKGWTGLSRQSEGQSENLIQFVTICPSQRVIVLSGKDHFNICSLGHRADGIPNAKDNQILQQRSNLNAETSTHSSEISQRLVFGDLTYEEKAGLTQNPNELYKKAIKTILNISVFSEEERKVFVMVQQDMMEIIDELIESVGRINDQNIVYKNRKHRIDKLYREDVESTNETGNLGVIAPTTWPSTTQNNESNPPTSLTKIGLSDSSDVEVKQSNVSTKTSSELKPLI